MPLYQSDLSGTMVACIYCRLTCFQLNLSMTRQRIISHSYSSYFYLGNRTKISFLKKNSHNWRNRKTNEIFCFPYHNNLVKADTSAVSTGFYNSNLKVPKYISRILLWGHSSMIHRNILKMKGTYFSRNLSWKKI